MKFTVLIPTADNQGKRFAQRKLRAITDRFAFQFGGRSVEGPIDGMWIGPDGTVYRDRLLRVTVVTDAGRADELREFVREIGRELGQLAMYLEVVQDDGVEIMKIE